MKCLGRDFLYFLLQSYIGLNRAIRARVKKITQDTIVYQCVISLTFGQVGRPFANMLFRVNFVQKLIELLVLFTALFV